MQNFRRQKGDDRDIVLEGKRRLQREREMVRGIEREKNRTEMKNRSFFFISKLHSDKKNTQEILNLGERKNN